MFRLHNLWEGWVKHGEDEWEKMRTARQRVWQEDTLREHQFPEREERERDVEEKERRKSSANTLNSPLSSYLTWMKYFFFKSLLPHHRPVIMIKKWFKLRNRNSLSLPLLPSLWSSLSPSTSCFVFIATGDDWIILFEICKSEREEDILTCWMRKQWSLRGERYLVCQRLCHRFIAKRAETLFWSILNGIKESQLWHLYYEICAVIKKKKKSWTSGNRQVTTCVTVYPIVREKISLIKPKISPC